MKLAVSTLGMPGQSLGDAIAIAAGNGCDGLELRLHPDTGVHLDMTEADVAAANRAITASGLEVLALAGYARVAAPGPDAPVVEEIVKGLRLADALGARGLRVFPGGEDTAAAARRIRAALAETWRPAGVETLAAARVLVETHDEMATGEAVVRLLEATGLPEQTGAIWDILHPWRHGEPPARTHEALGGWLGYVQIKDAASAAEPVPVLLGEGAVPLRAAGELLRAAGYAGWASLEWERTWYPQVGPVTDVLPGAREWTDTFSFS
ncbi:MAG: sugar phosphate isomerase/epimerase family protein [Trebonia sp.]